MKVLPEDLDIEYRYFQLLRRSKSITKEQYERQKSRIFREAELRVIKAESIRRQAEFLRKEKEKKRAVFKKKNILFSGSGRIELLLWKAFEATKGIKAMRAIVDDTEDFEVSNIGSSTEFFHQFIVYAYGGYSYRIKKNLVLVKKTRLVGEKLRQAFRDGIDHCVFTPLFERLSMDIERSDNKDRKKRLGQRWERLKKLYQEYADGVPEDKMNSVAIASGYKIVIHDILGNEMAVYNSNQHNVIRFTNTRNDHLDSGFMTLDSDSVKLNQGELCSIWKTLIRTKKFYLIDGDLKAHKPRKIRTLDGCYELDDANNKYYDDMNDFIDLKKYRLNATKHKDVNEFIKSGRIINSWVTSINDCSPTGHVDMPKAYTQFKKCKWYSGFLGVIHQWRSGSFDKDWISKHIGMYKFKVVGGVCDLFAKLGLGSEHILPSPEILYFMDEGVEIEITCGAWGSRMDFEFPDYMLSERRYCNWSGRLGMERQYKSYTFKCNAEWASHLVSSFGEDNVVYWEDTELCTVNVPKKTVYTTHHILAFITSYVRIQMMEEMKKFKVENICKVVMDGIYFIGEKPDTEFVDKPIALGNGHAGGWYNFGDVSSVNWDSCWISDTTLLSGQGGCGKTYKVLTDAGFNDILFVTPQHTLGGEVREKYNINYTTIHKLIGEGCCPWKEEHSYPPVLFIDEVTQIEAAWIDKALRMYPESLIILAGDLDAVQWFQCRNGKPGEFSTVWKPTCKIIHIDGDRRSRDDSLSNLKLAIREQMKKVFIDGNSGEDMRMKIWAYENLLISDYESTVASFCGDTWIAGTNKTSAKLLAAGVCSGWYKKGGMVSDCEKPGYEKRGSFTIHAYQGKTLEHGKIVVSISDMFEYSMLYTAVSRAVHFDQLIFVQ